MGENDHLFELEEEWGLLTVYWIGGEVFQKRYNERIKEERGVEKWLRFGRGGFNRSCKIALVCENLNLEERHHNLGSKSLSKSLKHIQKHECH